MSLRFGKLIELAKSTDSSHRRELLRECTDIFFQTSGERNTRESALLDDVLQMVAAEMQENVLAELANTFADAKDAPLGLMRDLANRSFEVAAPILQRSTVLDDQTLLQVVAYQSQAHIQAVAKRAHVSEALSEAIVAKGDDVALDTLIRNEGAKIARPTLEVAVDRAQRNSLLHEAVVMRRDLPLDLLNEMYFTVQTQLRDQIMARNAAVDPVALDAALTKARERLRKTMGQANAETRNARIFIEAKKKTGELNARLLVSLYREAKQAHFLYGLAEITSVDYDTAAELIQRRDIEGLAMICRAAGIERPLFVTLAVMCCGGDDAMAKAEEYGRMYNAVPVEAAQRAIRFYKVRKAAEAA
jgi:uncharacterized protein (DUF2336 family)